MEPALGPVLAELPPTRRALLVTLRKRGEARAEELAQELGVTVSAIRQHLAGLAAADLVVHRDERSGPGRPRRSYALGPAAEALFPKAYGTLTLELLDHLADEDPGVVRRAFERRRDARVARVRARLEGLSFEQQVAEVAKVLDEDGYLADLSRTDDGEGFLLREHNCAILAVARRYGHACATELSFLREVLPGAKVTRVAHILSGHHACVYEVRPEAATDAA
ncbi:helix-turn-helix transcriptional regulator [Conexibacter arvalis]|uniref:Putative ArsR family transcriptional regulator n=1 Tax=Conexibacter arvalis TaxID=912552 RepID=A0A840IDT2_9ACTN|nr:ArsR family transcriptional regulator [Conexibacter arvalis]MBB4663127.1 putative ArsR family transcriptional regulator [Conexibacter arvalis]